MRNVEILVSGRVQGVGYRYFALRKAKSLNIKGTVQNLWSGKVKIIAQCEETSLKIFLKELKKGPIMSYVSKLEISELSSTKEYNDFRVKF